MISPINTQFMVVMVNIACQGTDIIVECRCPPMSYTINKDYK